MRQTGTKDFTPEQRRRIREIVYTGMLTRRTTEEIQMQVENKVNIAISYNTVKHLRWNIRKQAHQELLNMKRDNDLFMYQYMSDIHQIDHCIRLQYDNLRDEQDVSKRKGCLDSIANYVIIRHKLYDFLPILASMKPFEDAEKVVMPG